MKKQWLVTGAAGYLGSAVCRDLIASGENVVALVLPGDPAAKRLPPGVEIRTGNILNIQELESFFSDTADIERIVIHAAGIVTTYPGYNQKVYDINVTGAKNVIDMCVKHRVKKLVYISSSSVIPEKPKGFVQTEVNCFSPENIVGFYAKTKAEASEYVKQAVRNNGLNASIVFPTAICGPGDYAYGHFTQLMTDCANGKLPAGITGGFDAADVRDIAHGIILCAKYGKSGEGYILGNQFISVREFFTIISRLTGTKEIKLMLPLWTAKAIVPFAAIYYKVAKRPPIFTAYALYNLVRNNMYSSDKARIELGYQTRPFEETIQDSLNWLRKERKITYGKKRLKMCRRTDTHF